MLNLCLYRPEIPPNTGNIGRLCVGINAHLHIIGTPSFDLSEKSARRAGLDYWQHLHLFQHTEWGDFLTTVADVSRVFLVTKFGKSRYTDLNYKQNDYFVFGRETSGLPETIRESVSDENKIHIPMSPQCRSLNLSNSAAVVAYEVIRQLNIRVF